MEKKPTMTPKDIDRISRSWVGHVVTNPALRKKMNAAKDDHERALLINETLIPKDDVKHNDVEAIQIRVKEMFDEENQPDPDKKHGTFQFFG